MEKQELAFMQKLANPLGMQAAFANYLVLAGLTDQQAKEAMTNKTLSDTDFMHAQTVAAISQLDFFTGSISAGLTNMSSFLRAENEHMIITGIRVSEGLSAAVNTTQWVRGLSSTALLNAFFTFSVNNVVQLDKIMGLEFADADDIDAGIFTFLDPIFWKGQDNIKINVDFQTNPIANQNLAIELIGLGLI